MPELPEVESLRRRLRHLTKKRVLDFTVLNKGTFKDACEHRQLSETEPYIEKISRRGKHLVLHLSGGNLLIFHLRMSGDLFYQKAETPLDKHIRFCLNFTDGSRLELHDPRKFARVVLTNDYRAFFAKLGIEALSSRLNSSMLSNLCKKSKKPIKVFLLDQSKISGLGNIYVGEVLWKAKISPYKPANLLTAKEAESLTNAIRRILSAAIMKGGTDLGDGVWKSGGYTPRIYGREGIFCPRRCKEKLVRVQISGRGTVLCPSCQKWA